MGDVTYISPRRHAPNSVLVDELIDPCTGRNIRWDELALMNIERLTQILAEHTNREKIRDLFECAAGNKNRVVRVRIVLDNIPGPEIPSDG